MVKFRTGFSALSSVIDKLRQGWGLLMLLELIFVMANPDNARR